MALLTFIIPVRHHRSVGNWQIARAYLAQTLASIAAQTSGLWNCIVVANHGTDLPDMPRKCHAVRVDLPLTQMPDRNDDLEGYYDAIRQDKGLRLLAGLKHVDPASHVMVVDYDDFVHRDLAKFVADRRQSAGWRIGRGLVWSGGRIFFAMRNFHRLCGTSHIIRRDLLGTFINHAGQVDMARVKRRLGSHIFIDDDVAAEGHPLEELPFAGAVYRVGNVQSASGSGELISYMTPARDIWRRPKFFLRNLISYRYLDDQTRSRFTLPTSKQDGSYLSYLRPYANDSRS